MNYRCDEPLFPFDAALGMVAASDRTTRIFGPGDAVSCV
jgi:hypothetical protein